MTGRFTVENALRITAESERRIYGVLLEHGTLELGFYTPDGVDPQEPHDQDDYPDYGPAARIRPCVNSPSQVHEAAGTPRSRRPFAILDQGSVDLDSGLR